MFSFRRPSSLGRAQVVWVEGEKVLLMVQKSSLGYILRN